ncbi:MAG: FUSC family protein [Prochlorococcaceae cyanobacterium]
MTAPAAAPGQGLRLVVCIALVSGLTWAVCRAIGLGAGTPYGVVIGALMVRPRFDRWPAPVFVLLPVVVLLGLGIGTFLNPLLPPPLVLRFAVVVVIAQLLAQALPDKLSLVRNVLALLAVLPRLGPDPSWLTAWRQLLAVLVGLVIALVLQAGLRLPADTGAGAAAAAEPGLPHRRLSQRFADPFFLRRLLVAPLSLSIGMGLGATQPKYLYFGVLLLLNDSLGATLQRVRDRMVGVSLGVLMPWVVFNTMGTGSISVALVMGGTTAVVLALGLEEHLRTALISSGVTFVGYGVLLDWYIPDRWLDYLMGSGLALLVCLLMHPFSALRRFRQLAEPLAAAGSGAASSAAPCPAELAALLPSALEEARVLGQEPAFRRLLGRLPAGGDGGGGAEGR